MHSPSLTATARATGATHGADELALMRQAGRIAALTHQALVPFLRPGVSTAELNAVAEHTLRSYGAEPTFLGYQGFPAAICTSRNDEIVHGIPHPDVLLVDGDILSIDLGATFNGWVADSAWTYAIGATVPDRTQHLLAVTREALEAAIAAARPGSHLGDISHAIQTHVESHGLTVLRELTGHGIGARMHEAPTILNYGRPGSGPLLRPGMTLAIEPMVSIGSQWRTRQASDGWTVLTADGALSAHFEHTIAITHGAAEILTAP